MAPRVSNDFTITPVQGQSIDAAISAVSARLQKAALTVPKIVRRELRRGLQESIDEVKKAKPLRGNKIYKGLRVAEVNVGGNDIAMAIRGNRLLAVHEFGAVIHAKRSKYLTIPLDAALKDGFRKKRKSSRDWKRTFVIRSKKGNLLVVQKRGKRLIPLYVLKKQVKIPARLGLRNAIGRNMPRVLTRVLDAMDKELARNG